MRPASAVVSALLLAAAAPPVGAAPLAWIALVPLFAACSGAPPRRAAAYALLSGSVYFGLHLTWIFTFGWMAWTALTVVMALYWTAAGWMIARVEGSPLAAAGAWTLMELVRDRWPFGGFPWGAAGTTQGAVPGVRYVAGAIGTYGLTFLIAFLAATVAGRRRTGRIAWRQLGAGTACVLVFLAADAGVTAGRPDGKPLRLAVVQGDVPRPVRFDQDDRVVASHVRLTLRLRDDPPDLVVWPESAIGFDATDVDAAATSAARIGVPILAGRAEPVPEREGFLNLVEHFDASGRLAGVYQKRHPVPFGEFVPIPVLRRYVSTLGQVPYDMLPGDRWTVFRVAGVRVATPVCFESVFPRDIRAFARRGAELHIVSTNDASFERSPASAQHLAHARMRALELRQWVVQAAISGITAVVAPDGTISHRTDLFEPALVRATVRARPASSLYAQTGDLFGWLWSAYALLAVARSRKRVA